MKSEELLFCILHDTAQSDEDNIFLSANVRH